jgi:plasmid stabilization system protein ParE
VNIVVAPRARRDLARQFDYLIEHDAASAARRLEQRLSNFVEHTLGAHPRAGIYLAHRDLWETWVPRTRFVVWYRFTDTELQIVRVWHTSQDRHRSA